MPYVLKQVPSDRDISKFTSPYSSLDPIYFKAVLRLRQINSDYDQLIEHFFEKHHLSNSRFSILFLLYQSEPQPIKQVEIARNLDLSRASVTGFLDSLEHDGMLQRQPCPGDKRAFHLRLTKRGIALVEKLLPHHVANMGRLTQCLKKEDVRQFNHLLEKLADGLSEQPPPRSKARKTSKKSSARR